MKHQTKNQYSDRIPNLLSEASDTISEPVLEDPTTFALLGGGEPYSDSEVCSDELCWEVEVLWKGEGSYPSRSLWVSHVGAEESLVLGEGGAVELPGVVLGGPSLTLIEDGTLTLPGEAPELLAVGAEWSVVFGAFELKVCAIRAPKNIVPRLGKVDTKSAGAIAGTMVVAAAFLAIFAMLPPTGMAMNHNTQDHHERLAEMMMTVEEAQERELEVFDGVEESSSESGGAERGDEGAMGTQQSEAAGRRYAIEGNARPNERRLSRHEQREQARTAGIIGVLGGLSAPSPTSIYGADTAIGSDPVSALGAMTGQEIGSSFGFGGLGLDGTGRHGGGEGLGTIGVMDGGAGIGATCVADYCQQGAGGSGGGTGVLRDRPRDSVVPLAVPGRSTVSGGLSREVIRRTVQRHLNGVRHCYQQELQSNPSLAGRVAVRFVITPDGSIGAATVSSTSMQNRAVEQCVAGAVRRMGFPQSESPTIVTYPFIFASR